VEELNISHNFEKQAKFRDLLLTVGDYGIKDIVILQNNEYIVDWHIENIDRINYIFSCTKSLLSSLIGIAIDKKYITSVNQPVVDFFPKWKNITLDPRIENITIEHLLTMTSGLDWPPMDRSKNIYNQMIKSENWVEFVLARSITYDPGVHFTYSDGGSHLLSAIITCVSGKSALEFASQFLFPFIGIQHAKWKENHGINLGGTGLHIRSIDMAKFGYLFLSQGRIYNTQVISREWVETSIKRHSNGHPEWFGYYGYHWWISPKTLNGMIDMYYALGSHGQYIFILPSKNAVAVFRKKPGKKMDVLLPKKIFFENVLQYL